MAARVRIGAAVGCTELKLLSSSGFDAIDVRKLQLPQGGHSVSACMPVKPGRAISEEKIHLWRKTHPSDLL